MHCSKGHAEITDILSVEEAMGNGEAHMVEMEMKRMEIIETACLDGIRNRRSASRPAHSGLEYDGTPQWSRITIRQD